MITNTTTSNSNKSDERSDICSNNNLIEDITTTTTTQTTATMVSISDEDDSLFRTTEEEEDMANCLILLAQGHSRPHSPPTHILSFVDNNKELTLKTNNNNNNNKFVSRKFMEASSSTQGRSGYYVYECKTCGKTFSSFQALGGHRASHKKPKNNDEDYSTTKAVARSNTNNNLFSTITLPKNNRNSYNNNINVVTSDDEELSFKVARHTHNNIASSTSLSLQLTNRASWGQQSYNNNNKGRVHECSICGAEFSSGQALGGHMRRHRGPLSSASTTTIAPTIAAIPLSVQQPPRNNIIITNNNQNSNNNTNTNTLSLNLDLNLPAPAEENNINIDEVKSDSSKLNHQQTTTKENVQQPSSPPPHQQQQHVFPSPTLVDCQY